MAKISRHKLTAFVYAVNLKYFVKKRVFLKLMEFLIIQIQMMIL